MASDEDGERDGGEDDVTELDGVGRGWRCGVGGGEVSAGPSRLLPCPRSKQANSR